MFKAEASIEDLGRRLAEAERRLANLPAAAAFKEAEASIERLRRQTVTTEKLLTRPPGVPPPETMRLASPAVSVVVPTYNRARIVGDAIASVLGQSFSDWELIIVDDGSADDTGAMVTRVFSDTRIRYVRQDHAGPSAARNRGIREARAGLVSFLDSDNLYYPDFLAAAVDAFRADPTLDVVYGALVSEHHPQLKGTRIMWRPFDRNDLLRGNFIDTNTLACRKSALEAAGGWDEALFGLEDWDLVIRLTGEKPAQPIPVLAAYYRVMDSIRIRDGASAAECYAAFRQKHGPPPP